MTGPTQWARLGLALSLGLFVGLGCAPSKNSETVEASDADRAGSDATRVGAAGSKAASPTTEGKSQGQAGSMEPPAAELRDALPSASGSGASGSDGAGADQSAAAAASPQGKAASEPPSKAPARPQGPPPTPPTTLAPLDGGEELSGDEKTLRDALVAQLETDGIEINLEARTVSIGIEVVQPVDPLEYVLIHQKGKDHESLLMTQAKPSKLNAALGLLGLRPGVNAQVKMKDPPPTFEEVEAGADPMIITPPGGMRVWMTAAFSIDGERKVFPVEDLVIDLSTGLPMADNEWVFLGGNKAPLYRNEPPVFMADYEGNLVSAVYMIPPNHLVTNRHPKARDEFNWWVAKVCPQPGTVGKLTFHIREPAIYRGRVERLAKMAAAMKAKGEKDKNTIEREPSDGPRRR